MDLQKENMLLKMEQDNIALLTALKNIQSTIASSPYSLTAREEACLKMATETIDKQETATA